MEYGGGLFRFGCLFLLGNLLYWYGGFDLLGRFGCGLYLVVWFWDMFIWIFLCWLLDVLFCIVCDVGLYFGVGFLIWFGYDVDWVLDV